MKTDQQDVHIVRFLTKSFVNVCVLRSISVLGANGLIQTSAYVNVLILDQHAAIPSTSTVINASVSVLTLDQHAKILNFTTVRHASASAPILNQNAASLRFSILQHVNVSAPLLHHHAKHHTNTILTLVPVSVLHTHARILSTLTVRRAAASVAIDIPAQRTRSLTKRLVNVSVPG